MQLPKQPTASVYSILTPYIPPLHSMLQFLGQWQEGYPVFVQCVQVLYSMYRFHPVCTGFIQFLQSSHRRWKHSLEKQVQWACNRMSASWLIDLYSNWRISIEVGCLLLWFSWIEPWWVIRCLNLYYVNRTILKTLKLQWKVGLISYKKFVWCTGCSHNLWNDLYIPISRKIYNLGKYPRCRWKAYCFLVLRYHGQQRSSRDDDGGS